MKTRTGNTTASSAIITTLRRTVDLQVGMNIYGTGIPVNAKIESIDSGTQVTMDQDATATGTPSLAFTTANVGVFLERQCALVDSKAVIDERGDLVEIFIRDEGEITRDRYGAVKKNIQTTQYRFRAHPVQFQPSDKQLEAAGLRERATVIIYTSMKDWIDSGIEFEDLRLDMKSSVKLQGDVYEIREKALTGQMNDQYIYLTLGLFKR